MTRDSDQEWRPITEPPDRNGYVLLAITHHNIPQVVQGFYQICQGIPRYKEETYGGRGVQVTHWMPMPKHPYAREGRA